MAGFLVAEEGPLAGLIVRFEEGEEWILGRDPDVSYQVLEDPMVSRKHVICRKTDDGYVLENLSAINPATVNGKPVEEPILLQEGDTVQVGNVFFHFTLKDPAEQQEAKEELSDEGSPTIYEESDDLGALAFSGAADSRWIIKVISGPNAGAEFGLHEGSTFVIGKDPATCDILFQDLSVSRQHAKIISGKDGKVTIEDLGSLNKVLINGQETSGITELKTQDLIALGTTSFLVIDQQQTRETIISPTAGMDYIPPSQEEGAEGVQDTGEETAVAKNWKKMVIPTRHLILAGVFAILLILGLGSVFSLFKSEVVTHSVADESQEISKTLTQFPEVEFSYNPSSGKIFLLGHVMTEIDQQEMIYLLKSLPFVKTMEDNVIIDELVWENTNALMMKNAAWRGVNLTSIVPGHFVLRGYVQTLEDATKLSEYININFPYLDKLDNQVVVENTLEAQIQSVLTENQFGNVTFQFSNGELILAGRVPSNQESAYNTMVTTLKKLQGVRLVKNFVVLSKPTSDIVDISSKYKVTGSSKYGNTSQYVVINGKILSVGSKLDGMTIINMENNSIFLEKDGIKYKINYNQP
ncbi:MAG: type III secretion system inner membrane ring subunit SctD [Simkaniaceae bacterium]|nr:type III secretion system inner membrane ring subunit SctD [Simkaniaceae bacterium]